MRDEKVKDVPCPKPRHTGWAGKCMECANEMKQNLEVGEPPVHAGLSRLLSRSDGQAPQRDENTKPTGSTGRCHSCGCVTAIVNDKCEECTYKMERGVAPQPEAPTQCNFCAFEGSLGDVYEHAIKQHPEKLRRPKVEAVAPPQAAPTEQEIRTDERHKTIRILANALKKFQPKMAGQLAEEWRIATGEELMEILRKDGE